MTRKEQKNKIVYKIAYSKRKGGINYPTEDKNYHMNFKEEQQ